MRTQGNNDLILESSNFGARLFELGWLEEAKTQFRYALDRLQVVQTRRSITSITSSSSSSVSTYISSSSEEQSSPKHPIRGWTRPLRKEDDQIFVYSRAVDLNPSFDIQQYPIYQTCIAYNLALTLHLIALRKASSADYQTASSLYEDSMKALELAFDSCSCSDYLNDLRIVILNNAGHIYFSALVNYSAASQCFQAVCGIAISDSTSSLPAEEVDRMVTNVLLTYSMTAPMA
jgi:hypothetical protein